MLKYNLQRFKKLCLFILSASLLFACSKSPDRNSISKEAPIVIGWQTAWSPSGQIAQTLIHTDIAKKENLNLKLVGFLYGPDMNEAAINHNINGLNTGNVPATSLLAKSSDWVIIARLIRQPLSIIARNETGIKEIKDLKGKTMGIGYGTGPHPYLLCLLKARGLWDGKSELPLKLMNIAPSEQVMALQQKAVDAIATWEPQTTIAILKKLGTVIDQDAAPGFIIIEKKFTNDHPETIVRLLKAYLQAEYFVATHKELTDDWFAAGSRFSKNLISKIKIIEPNLLQKDPHKIDLMLTNQDIDKCQQHADAMFEAGLIKQPVKIRDRIDLSFFKKAQAEWQKEASNLTAIHMSQP